MMSFRNITNFDISNSVSYSDVDVLRFSTSPDTGIGQGGGAVHHIAGSSSHREVFYPNYPKHTHEIPLKCPSKEGIPQNLPSIVIGQPVPNVHIPPDPNIKNDRGGGTMKRFNSRSGMGIHEFQGGGIVPENIVFVD